MIPAGTLPWYVLSDLLVATIGCPAVHDDVTVYYGLLVPVRESDRTLARVLIDRFKKAAQT
jgi:hypothetical protein